MLELNIALVDDTLQDIMKLEGIITDYFSLSTHNLKGITRYSSGEELLKYFKPKTFSIIFLDIIMNSLNGIETAKYIRDSDTEVLIVFITTSREYAFEAFTVHPFDYIVKPYSIENVNYVLDEALRCLSDDEPSITVRASYSEYNIPLRLISSIVSQGHRIEISLIDGRTCLSTMKFIEAEELTALDKRFLKCNRGILLNMSQISSHDNGVFIMRNGTRYPIRVRGYAEVMSRFSEYLIANMRSLNSLNE